MAAISTTYDPIFARHAGHLPVAFMRALAKRESSMNPSSVMPGTTNSARGLMQVVGVVREGWNKRTGQNVQPDDLLDPNLNVKIAADSINRTIAAFGKHPSPNMKMDWSNPEFVKILTAGWNSGHSEAGGVGRVASYLEARGIPVTHDAIFEHAGDAGATIHLQNPDRRAWQRSVVDLFYQQPDWNSGGSAIKVIIAGFVAWGIYKLALT